MTLNVQLVDKNDKKLVKINLNSFQNNNNNINNQLVNPIDNLKNQIKLMINNSGEEFVSSVGSLNQSSRKENTHSVESSFVLNDDDDLPSESDVSSGMTLVTVKESLNAKHLDVNQQSANNFQQTQTQLTPISLLFGCAKCSTSFLDEKQYKIHVEACLATNENENIYSQRDIENLLINESNLMLPQVDTDENENSNQSNGKMGSKRRILICNECGFQFNFQSDLNKHMLQAHDRFRSFKCCHCNMEFNDISSKTRHEKEHFGLKPFRCYICSFEFTRASNLRTHLFKMHSSDIGKLVNITKSVDNKLKFEFDLGITIKLIVIIS